MQEAKLIDTGLISLKLDCGCEVIYKEIGAASCYDHGFNDPVRQKQDLATLAVQGRTDEKAQGSAAQLFLCGYERKDGTWTATPNLAAAIHD